MSGILCPRSDKFDKRVKRLSPKVRRIIATEGLVRGKNQVREGGTNFAVSHIKLEEWLPCGKVYVTPV